MYSTESVSCSWQCASLAVLLPEEEEEEEEREKDEEAKEKAGWEKKRTDASTVLWPMVTEGEGVRGGEG